MHFAHLTRRSQVGLKHARAGTLPELDADVNTLSLPVMESFRIPSSSSRTCYRHYRALWAVASISILLLPSECSPSRVASATSQASLNQKAQVSADGAASSADCG